MAGGRRCLAKLKSGKRCSNRGKEEYQGYCGIHRLQASPAKEAKDKIQRTALLVGMTSSLVILVEKAVQYLPDLAEILVKASQLAFIREQGAEIPKDAAPFTIRPREIRDHIESAVRDAQTQRLVEILSSSLEQYISTGDLPAKLKDEIVRENNALLLKLGKMGYHPILSRGDFGSDLPDFVKPL